MVDGAESLVALAFGLGLGVALGRTYGATRAHEGTIPRDGADAATPRGHRPGYQQRGELHLAAALRDRFDGPDYHLLNHVTLPLGDGTTQVDHILVSRFGIVVIETKDWRGWIFGAAMDRTWTQVRGRARDQRQNPLRQNHVHLCAVQAILDFLPFEAIRGAVVFTGDAEFRTPVPDGVYMLPTFVAELRARTTPVMSRNRMQFCVGRLETARLAITRETDVEHVRRLERRFGRLA